MSDIPIPRPVRSHSSSRSVTVSASRKSKPKNAPFKFLRKDEGRLSYTCQPDSPLSANNQNHYAAHRDSPSSERRGSRSLREAIANDMRRGKNHDPFAEVVIAVPKRTPPPNPAAREEAQDFLELSLQERGLSQLQQQPQRQQQEQVEKKPERDIDEDLDSNEAFLATAKPRQRSRGSDDPDRSTEVVGQRLNTNQSHSTPRREEEYEDMKWQRPVQRRYRGEDKVQDNGGTRNPPLRRYLDPMGQEDEYPRSARNYFLRPQLQGYRPTREEDNLVEQLEEELHAVQEERGRYHQLKMQLDRDRKRFEEYRNGIEREIEEERADLNAARASENWQAKKDVKVVEERYRSTLELLKNERESNKKLSQENELLRQQLEGMTTHMRETQKLQKAETSRLRREIESLTRRNEELLEMTREQQIAALENSSKINSPAPVLQITSNAWRPNVGSSVSTQRSCEEVLDFPEFRSTVGSSMQQQQSNDFIWEAKQRRMAAEKERKRLEAEEKERKRLEAEKERKRLEAEEKERKRLEAEKERKRLEAEEKERKRLEAEEKERRRLEAEEKERKRLEAEKERKRLEAEEKEQRKEQQHARGEEGVTGGKSQELRSQRRVSGHPINTPRAQNASRGNASRLQASSVSSAVSISRKPRRTPTAEELVADDEPTPAEDFPNDAVVSQTALGENPNKRELLYRSGKREIHYVNGTRKVILPSGHVVLYFTNGDIKRTFPSGKSTYWYAVAQTTHTQHADGVQVFEFHSSGQIERHLPDGKKEILYPDGIYKVVFPDGRDETIFPDEV
ncbi:Spindle assembly abnormal 4 [Trypanosoma cruzi]|uniref:Spindle assembly abnormal 4 n=1 Tax=Trypanosoma cruzi TaxID=5693 RepID=A0A7J6Y1E4_TRYCR|nr:Spindle assembly abnormal 4 [Trypanosoma cruzi]